MKSCVKWDLSLSTGMNILHLGLRTLMLMRISIPCTAPRAVVLKAGGA